MEIDAAGRTLTPGQIDAHWHCMRASLPIAVMMTADMGDIHFAAAAQAERAQMRGFTTERGTGGRSFALKCAIDSGIVPETRIYPSGTTISQTSGHGVTEASGNCLAAEETLSGPRWSDADGRDAVSQTAREHLMQRASQFKIVAGGRASSARDPLDVLQFLPEAIKAAVLAAADQGTCVMAKVYTPRGIQTCLKSGVRSIEHGQLTDGDSPRMMADSGTVRSLPP